MRLLGATAPESPSVLRPGTTVGKAERCGGRWHRCAQKITAGWSGVFALHSTVPPRNGLYHLKTANAWVRTRSCISHRSVCCLPARSDRQAVDGRRRAVKGWALAGGMASRRSSSSHLLAHLSPRRRPGWPHFFGAVSSKRVTKVTMGRRVELMHSPRGEHQDDAVVALVQVASHAGGSSMDWHIRSGSPSSASGNVKTESDPNGATNGHATTAGGDFDPRRTEGGPDAITFDRSWWIRTGRRAGDRRARGVSRGDARGASVVAGRVPGGAFGDRGRSGRVSLRAGFHPGCRRPACGVATVFGLRDWPTRFRRMPS